MEKLVKRFKSKLKDEKGQNLVEFALIVGFLLAIFFGITEFARAWYTADRLKNAANIAARTYAVKNNETQAISAGVNAGGSGVTVRTVFRTSTTVKMEARASFRSVVPFMPTALSGVIPILNNITTIRRDATYRVEQ